MSDFKISYLDNIKDYSGIFSYGTSTICYSMKFYVSLKNSSSRYFVCDFIDKQPDGRLVIRTLDHMYHKVKFDKIIDGSFVDPVTNRRISIEQFSEIMQTLKHNKDYSDILYMDDRIANEDGVVNVANFILNYSDLYNLDGDVGHSWRVTYNEVEQIPFSFYIDSLLSAYNQFLKK